MMTHKMIARLVGTFYIIGTVAGVLSVAFSGGILDKPDYLAEISAHEDQFTLGALCVLIMGLALAMVPIMLYSIMKKYSEPLAVGYVVFRGALETVVHIALVTTWLALVAINQETTLAANAANLEAAGTLLVKIGDSITTLGAIVFPLGALMLYTVFYRSKLVPRWLSGWGLAAVVFYLAAAFLDLFAFIEPTDTSSTLLFMPMAVQEMVMAVWLILKGFNPSALVAAPAQA